MARSKSKEAAAESRPSPLARRIVERWAEAGGDIALDRLVSELGDVQRYDIVAALKELERAGAGELLVARAGKKARFVWSANAARIAATRRKPAEPKRAPARPAAAADNAGAKPRTAAKAGSPGRATPLLAHVFHLRPNVVVTVHLPADVTRVEVERFCLFLRALPFEGSEG